MSVVLDIFLNKVVTMEKRRNVKVKRFNLVAEKKIFLGILQGDIYYTYYTYTYYRI